MKKSQKATTIIEAIIVTLILLSGITGMYKIFNESIRLSTSTENKIHAIQIAKQGIEAFTNIRNTNWLVFSSDYENCWNTDISTHGTNDCIGDTTTDYDIKLDNDERFIIFRNPNNRWILEKKGEGTYGLGTYNSDYRISLDDKGIYTQTGTSNFNPLFTREINIEYLKADGVTAGDSNDPKMIVTSLVQWLDNSSTTPHRVEFKQMLSNRMK